MTIKIYLSTFGIFFYSVHELNVQNIASRFVATLQEAPSLLEAD